MLEHINAHLEAGEKTPDWDSQKLRGHITVLHSTEMYMSKEEHDRFLALVERLRGRMKQMMMPAA